MEKTTFSCYNSKRIIDSKRGNDIMKGSKCDIKNKENITDNNLNDKGYKALLSSKKIFLELLRTFVKNDWTEQIDEKSIIKVDKSFILNDFNQKEADLVYRVKLKDKEIIFYVLMELQSKVDFLMPFRLLQYILEVWRDIFNAEDTKKRMQKEFKLPVIVPIVLYNGKYNWNVSRNYKEILNGYEIFSDYVLDFKYILIDVNRYTEEELIKIKNTITTVFYLDQKVDSEIFLKRLKKVLEIAKALDEDGQRVLFNWIKNIFVKKLNIKNDKDIKKLIEGEQGGIEMVYALENILERTKKENYEKGIEKGIEQGIEKGIEQGTLNAAIALFEILDDKTISERLGIELKLVKRLRKEHLTK